MRRSTSSIKGGDLRLVAAWTARLLSSVAPFHFESLLKVAISVQLLRRIVLLSQPSEIRRKRVRSVSMLATIPFLFCAVHHL